ncbi:MAG: 2,3-bisphosphoglycerate-independent phosphoglycerate mutase, partial [Bacteroidota bacterium]|nr:2,3-bisphosphoglycerate-independent phosphoglycerate mutase [Bacteroidota bacterium]
ARHPDGSPHTAHTTNPVPVVILSKYVDSIQDGILADVAPTVLKLMGIPQPSEMTGKALH